MLQVKVLVVSFQNLRVLQHLTTTYLSTELLNWINTIKYLIIVVIMSVISRLKLKP